MLRCRDIIDLLEKCLDGTLDSDTAGALERHLTGCQPCTAFLNTYRGTVRTTRRLKEEQLPPELRRRLLTFLRQRQRA